MIIDYTQIPGQEYSDFDVKAEGSLAEGREKPSLESHLLLDHEQEDLPVESEEPIQAE